MAREADLLIFDAESGTPAWSHGTRTNDPKAAFVLGVAKKWKAGSLSLNRLQQLILNAVNADLHRRGKPISVSSLTDVQKMVSGTPHMWFNELKRVLQSEGGADELIDREGKGLTSLYRRIGPHQYQKPKNTPDIRGVLARRIQEIIPEVSQIGDGELSSHAAAIDALIMQLKRARG